MNDERRLSLRTTPAHAGRRLDEVLAGWLPEALSLPLSKARLRRLVMAGAIRVDGVVSRRPGQPVRAGRRIDARVRLDLLADATARDRPFTLTAARILYEDDQLLAVDKPPGLPTPPTVDPRRPSLFGAVRSWLAAHRDGPSYLGLHQRLDRDTSGVVLFTRDPAANPGLARAFAQHEVRKAYCALVAGPAHPPARPWRAESALASVGQGAQARMASVQSGGARAVTDFEVKQVLSRGLLVEARPLTGRKHQIRVHLAEAGLPILGDDRYGTSAAGLTAPRLMLHAARLELEHPTTGEPLVIESPLPEDFRQVLAALGLSAVPARKRPG